MIETSKSCILLLTVLIFWEEQGYGQDILIVKRSIFAARLEHRDSWQYGRDMFCKE